eukprot:1142580-Pelagomonas_calceolata.AAC.2
MIAAKGRLMRGVGDEWPFQGSVLTSDLDRLKDTKHNSLFRRSMRAVVHMSLRQHFYIIQSEWSSSVVRLNPILSGNSKQDTVRCDQVVPEGVLLYYSWCSTHARMLAGLHWHRLQEKEGLQSKRLTASLLIKKCIGTAAPTCAHQ